jgi:hypothetical protein
MVTHGLLEGEWLGMSEGKWLFMGISSCECEWFGDNFIGR